MCITSGHISQNDFNVMITRCIFEGLVIPSPFLFYSDVNHHNLYSIKLFVHRCNTQHSDSSGSFINM